MCNDIITIFRLYLPPAVTKRAAKARLDETYSANVFFCWAFSTLPTQLIGIMWMNPMLQLRDLHYALQREPFFDVIVPNILYIGYIFATWQDTLLQERGVPQRR